VATISLGAPLPTPSCTPPAPVPRTAVRATRRPKSCLRLHAVGFALPRPSPVGRCALTAPFHPCRRFPAGGLFSVALSLTRSGPVAVGHHRVLSCSDFPRPSGARTRPPVQHPDGRRASGDRRSSESSWIGTSLVATRRPRSIACAPPCPIHHRDRLTRLRCDLPSGRMPMPVSCSNRFAGMRGSR